MILTLVDKKVKIILSFSEMKAIFKYLLDTKC